MRKVFHIFTRPKPKAWVNNNMTILPVHCFLIHFATNAKEIIEKFILIHHVFKVFSFIYKKLYKSYYKPVSCIWMLIAGGEQENTGAEKNNSPHINVYIFCRSKILKDMPRIEGRPGQELAPLDFDKLKEDIKEHYPEVRIL